MTKMTLGQYRGYYLEGMIQSLMRKTGYIEVTCGIIEGRGADHPIDSYGFLGYPIPFINKIRLIAEVKWCSDDVELPAVRNFFGTLKDISENYFVPGWLRRRQDLLYFLSERYTDSGAFFSVTDFTPPAQGFAWAHNICLVPLGSNRIYGQMINIAKDLTENEYNKLQMPKKKMALDQAINDMNTNEDLIAAYNIIFPYVGLINGIYPIFIFSKQPFNFTYDSSDETDEISNSAIKEYRIQHDNSIDFYFSFQNSNFSFTVPTLIAQQLIKLFNSSKSQAKPFSFIELFILVKGPKGKPIRRIIKINLFIPPEFIKILENDRND